MQNISLILSTLNAFVGLGEEAPWKTELGPAAFALGLHSLRLSLRSTQQVPITF